MNRIKKIILITASIVVVFALVVAMVSYFGNKKEGTQFKEIKEGTISTENFIGRIENNNDLVKTENDLEIENNSQDDSTVEQDSNNVNSSFKNEKDNKNTEDISTIKSTVEGLNETDDIKEREIDERQIKNSEDKTTEDDEEDEKIIPDDGTVLYVEDIKANAGDKNIMLSINVKNNPGILGMSFTVFFDDNVMELKSVSNGDAFSDILTLTESKSLKTGCTFMWDGQEVSGTDIKDGAVLNLYFDVADNATPGKYSISLLCNSEDVVDKDLNPVKLQILNGTIKIKNK